MRRFPDYPFDNLKGVLLYNCAIGMNNKVRARMPDLTQMYARTHKEQGFAYFFCPI